MLSNEQLTAAERALVGAVFLDPKSYYEADISPAQFFDPRLGSIWNTVARLLGSANAGLDPVVVAATTHGIEPSFLTSLLLTTSITPDITGLAESVRDAWKLRQYKVLTADIADWEASDWSTDRIHTEIQQRLEAIGRGTRKKLPRLSAVIEQQIVSLQKPDRKPGLNTGLELERLVPGGIPSDKVSVIFGESGNFKSTVKNAIIENLAKCGNAVLDVSLEDSDELGAARAISRSTGLSYGDIVGEVHSFEKISDRIPKGFSLPWADRVFMAGEVPPNIDEIIRIARIYKHEHNIRAVFIDYIQLLEGGSRVDERTVLATAMRKAQLAAKRDKMAFVFVSQVNRALSGRESDRRPRLSDLFGSSTIEQHCKLAIGIYRPFKYDYEPTPSNNQMDQLYHEHWTNNPSFRQLYPGLIELSVQKNLVGENGIVHVEVNPATGRITPSSFRDMLNKE